MFVNVKNNNVLEVQGAKNTENANVGVTPARAPRNRNAHQRWNVVYLDSMAKQRVKGMNTNFGFYINRPFYIMSKTWMNRVITASGNNLVIKTRAQNNKRQHFFFDQVTKTIRCKGHHAGYSMEIQNNGRSSNARMYTTNSRWW